MRSQRVFAPGQFMASGHESLAEVFAKAAAKRAEVRKKLIARFFKLFSVKAPAVVKRCVARCKPQVPRGITPDKPRPGLPVPFCPQLNRTMSAARYYAISGTKGHTGRTMSANDSGNYNGKSKPQKSDRRDYAMVTKSKTSAVHV